MDPLSLTTAAFALIAVTKSCYDVLREFQTSCKEAKDDLSRLKRQLETLDVLLHHVSSLSSSDVSSIPKDEQQHVLATVEDCKSLTLHVSDLLRKHAGSPRRSKLWWAAKGKKEALALMEKVELSKSTLSLIVAVQNQLTVVKVNSDTRAIRATSSTLVQTTAAIQDKTDMIPGMIHKFEHLRAEIAASQINGTSPKGLPEMLDQIQRSRRLMPRAGPSKQDLMAWVDGLTSYDGSVAATAGDSFDRANSTVDESRKGPSEPAHKRINFDASCLGPEAQMAQAQWSVGRNDFLESTRTKTDVVPGLLMVYKVEPRWELNQCCLSPSGSLAAGMWYQSNNASEYRYKMRFWCISEADQMLRYELVSDRLRAEISRPLHNRQVFRFVSDDIVAVQESEGCLAFWEIKTSKQIGVIAIDGRKAGAWDAAPWVSMHQCVATILENVVTLHYIAMGTRNTPTITTGQTLDLPGHDYIPQAVCFSGDGRKLVALSTRWLDDGDRVTISIYNTGHTDFSTLSLEEFTSQKIIPEHSMEIRLRIDIVRTPPPLPRDISQDTLRLAIRDTDNAVIVYDGRLVCLTVDIMTDSVRNHNPRKSLDRSIIRVSRNGKRAMVLSRDSDNIVRMHSLSIEHMVDADAAPEFTVTCPQEMDLQKAEAAISSDGETMLTWPGYLSQQDGSSKAIWSWKVLTN